MRKGAERERRLRHMQPLVGDAGQPARPKLAPHHRYVMRAITVFAVYGA
jgi:hypothetical protein